MCENWTGQSITATGWDSILLSMVLHVLAKRKANIISGISTKDMKYELLAH